MRLLPRTPADMTRRQWETLMTAYKMGYFRVPRESSLGEVADELGITHQSASEHMRLAHDKVCKALWNEMVSHEE